MKIVLASASPRRRELLATAGFEFDIVVAEVDESVPEGISPTQGAVLTARKKALAVAASQPDCCVIGADTVVVVDGDVLGKPHSRAQAIEMLTRLSGRTHTVVTGVCVVLGDKELSFADETRVEFYPLTREQIESYVDTGEPMDKAGAYGIQGRGCVLVKGISGDYFNVVGLPVARVARAIRQAMA